MACSEGASLSCFDTTCFTDAREWTFRELSPEDKRLTRSEGGKGHVRPRHRTLCLQYWIPLRGESAVGHAASTGGGAPAGRRGRGPRAARGTLDTR